MERRRSLKLLYIHISGHDSDEPVSMAFRLLEKVYMAGMYDIKGSEGHNRFHRLIIIP